MGWSEINKINRHNSAAPSTTSNQEFGISKTEPDVQFWILAGPKNFVRSQNVIEKVSKILHFHILAFFKQNKIGH